MSTLRQQIIAHIKMSDAGADRVLHEVAGAADVAGALQGRISTPSVFIIRGSNRRDDNGRTETLADQFLVLIAVKNVRDARGDDSSDAAENLSNAIASWLKPFTPQMAQGDQFDSLKRLRGSVQRWNDQVLVWGDTYQLTYVRRCCP
ncbi:MAG: hypothetical protein R3E64_04035 [Halioglobus sp.]